MCEYISGSVTGNGKREREKKRGNETETAEDDWGDMI